MEDLPPSSLLSKSVLNDIQNMSSSSWDLSCEEPVKNTCEESDQENSIDVLLRNDKKKCGFFLNSINSLPRRKKRLSNKGSDKICETSRLRQSDGTTERKLVDNDCNHIVDKEGNHSTDSGKRKKEASVSLFLFDSENSSVPPTSPCEMISKSRKSLQSSSKVPFFTSPSYSSETNSTPNNKVPKRENVPLSDTLFRELQDLSSLSWNSPLPKDSSPDLSNDGVFKSDKKEYSKTDRLDHSLRFFAKTERKTRNNSVKLEASNALVKDGLEDISRCPAIKNDECDNCEVPLFINQEPSEDLSNSAHSNTVNPNSVIPQCSMSSHLIGFC